MLAYVLGGIVLTCPVPIVPGFTGQECYSAAYLADCVDVPAGVSPAAGWTWDGSVFAAPAAPIAPTPTLADRRAALGVERYAKQISGVLFQAAAAKTASLAASDPASTGMMTSSYVAATSGHWVDGTPWKMSDGSFVPLTAGDMQAMALKVLGYISACYAREAALAAELETDLTTDITAGWPSNA